MPTKQLTRQEVEGVIDRLADMGSEIYIGNVLEKMQEKLKYLVSTATFTGCREKPHGTYEYFVSEVFAKVLHLYAQCGVAKSLQEIIEESIWENQPCEHCTNGYDTNGCTCVELLKSPEANALFSFLQEIV